MGRSCFSADRISAKMDDLSRVPHFAIPPRLATSTVTNRAPGLFKIHKLTGAANVRLIE